MCYEYFVESDLMYLAEGWSPNNNRFLDLGDSRISFLLLFSSLFISSTCALIPSIVCVCYEYKLFVVDDYCYYEAKIIISISVSAP